MCLANHRCSSTAARSHELGRGPRARPRSTNSAAVHELGRGPRARPRVHELGRGRQGGARSSFGPGIPVRATGPTCARDRNPWDRKPRPEAAGELGAGRSRRVGRRSGRRPRLRRATLRRARARPGPSRRARARPDGGSARIRPDAGELVQAAAGAGDSSRPPQTRRARPCRARRGRARPGRGRRARAYPGRGRRARSGRW